MPDPAAELCRLVRAGVAALADPVRAPQMQAYMKSALPYRGVTSQPLRRLLGGRNGLYALHPLPDRRTWESCVLELWDEAGYREERYAAMALTSHPLYRGYQDPAVLPLYRHLVVTGAWWDYVDSLASHNVGGILEGHPEEVTAAMRAWAVEDDLWVRRAAILCQLHRREQTDVDLLRSALEANLEGSAFGSQFFIRKAVGWALRQHARTDPGWVQAFVADHQDRLSALSTREALRHL